MKLREKIKAGADSAEKKLEELENAGNAKLKALPIKIEKWFDKKGLNNKKGILIIFAAALIFLVLTGGIFRVTSRPPYIKWINPIMSIQKAISINFNTKKGDFNHD